MKNIVYYRDENMPYFEMKRCTLNLHPEKKHAHDEYSIALIEKGSSVLEYWDEVIEIRDGQVVMIQSDIMHLCQPKDLMNWCYQMLYIKKSWFNKVLRNELKHKLLVKSLKPAEMKKVQSLFSMLKSKLSTIEKEESLIEVIQYVLNAHDCFVFNEERISNNDMACCKLQQYIKENFLKKIYLEELSDISGLSQYYIIKLFKQKYNITPHAYQVSCRMNYAKAEMIKGSDIVEIANEVGFYDQSHFSKTFKAYFGVTPQFYVK